MADLNDMTPPGYQTITIEPSRTGLNYPLYLKVEEVVDDKPALSQEGLFVPSNDIEAENVLNFVNQKRQAEKLAPVSMDTYNANQSNFMKYAKLIEPEFYKKIGFHDYETKMFGFVSWEKAKNGGKKDTQPCAGNPIGNLWKIYIPA